MSGAVVGSGRVPRLSFLGGLMKNVSKLLALAASGLALMVGLALTFRVRAPPVIGGRAPTNLLHPDPGVREMNPTEWWDASWIRDRVALRRDTRRVEIGRPHGGGE